jgi:hemerythrin superfamily protein
MRLSPRALMAHAQSEEQLLYPTTLLIGEYLELRRRAEK